MAERRYNHLVNSMEIKVRLERKEAARGK